MHIFFILFETRLIWQLLIESLESSRRGRSSLLLHLYLLDCVILPRGGQEHTRKSSTIHWMAAFTRECLILNILFDILFIGMDEWYFRSSQWGQIIGNIGGLSDLWTWSTHTLATHRAIWDWNLLLTSVFRVRVFITELSSRYATL